MNYPLISEYIEAIKSAEDNFDELKYLRPVLNDDGMPIMSVGGFSVVFKMQDEQSGKFYAVKCFTKEQEGRANAYREIANELKDVSSSYLVSIRYLEKELFVDTVQTAETEFPVLLMDWVEGKTLDKYLRENLDDKYALEMLAYRFSQLAQWLIPQPFAHGDLKPDNILVREDGTLVLVDYDGMYVPAMKGQKARELGSPNFRHPLRTEDDFDEHIDIFPLLSILLSLKAISLNPLLLEEFGGTDRLLLSDKDYQDIVGSSIINRFLFLLSINDFAKTYSLFITSLIKYGDYNEVVLEIKDLHYTLVYPEMLYYTKLHYEDHKEWFEDNLNVEYSKDGKRLIYGPFLYTPYEIRMGTEVICDRAMAGKYYRDGSGWREYDKIVIPESVKRIGVNPFAFSSINLSCNSSAFKVEDNVLYTADKSLLIGFYGHYYEDTFEVPEGVKYIGDYAFAGNHSLKRIKLPSSIISIGDNAFLGCKYLENIKLSDNLKYIGKDAFNQCECLKEIKLPIGLMIIGGSAFYFCTSLTSITIPSSVISIGANPFAYSGITDIICKSYLFEVDNSTLYTMGKSMLISCYSKELTFQIPKEVTHIGTEAFYGCRFKELFIHDNITCIANHAFDGCFYESFPIGYTMDILVTKGRYGWARKHITDRMYIKEIDEI